MPAVLEAGDLSKVPVLVTTLGDPENVIGGNGDGELVLGFVG